jgi:hypothetical protein
MRRGEEKRLEVSEIIRSLNGKPWDNQLHTFFMYDK